MAEAESSDVLCRKTKCSSDVGPKSCSHPSRHAPKPVEFVYGELVQDELVYIS